MADITIDLTGKEINNTLTTVISTDSIITFTIPVNETINVSDISNDIISTFIISVSSISNTNTVSVDTVVAFNVFLNSVENASTVSIPWYVDDNTIILANDIVNTNTVDDIDSILIIYQKFVDSIINTSTVSIVTFGLDREYNEDSVVNSNIISQPTITIENIPITTTFSTRTSINRAVNNDYVFSDLSLDFLAHPITGDIAILYDYDAINQSILNIIGTQQFERPFENYSVSSRIRRLLFELSGNLLLNELKSELFAAIINNEPRILLYDIIVYEKFEENSIGVQIYYKIRTFDRVVQLDTIITRI